MYRLILFVILLFIISCQKDDNIVEETDNIEYEVECIWDKSPHCAFTSIVKYNNKYYCCFREAESHIPNKSENYGSIRLLESTNGERWISVGLVKDIEYDLRDPYFSVTPDNKLMLICGSSSLGSDNILSFCHTRAYIYTPDIINSSDIKHHIISINNDDQYYSYWVWKIKWHKNIAYGVAYNNANYPLLVRSYDGVNFDIITQLGVYGNEASIEFVGDNMIVVCRSINYEENGFIGYSLYPYLEWNWNHLNHFIQSPEIINIDDNLILAGRGARGTTIYSIDCDTVTPIVSVRSDGDSGYPGMLCVDDKLWMSYYATPTTTKIYMAKFSVKDILQINE